MLRRSYGTLAKVAVVVVPLHLWLVLQLRPVHLRLLQLRPVHLRLLQLRLPHLGMVLVVPRCLLQPAFYACASGFVGRALC